jgi:PAS domain S-box-containing protein
VVIHFAGKIALVNKTAARLFGADDPEGLIDTALMERVHPGHRAIVDDRVPKATRDEGSVPAIEGKLLRLDGSSFDAEVTAMAIQYQGKPAMLALFNEITERRRMEQALRESEAKYRIVADNTHDWEFWVDPDDRFLYCSPSCKAVTGYDAETFIADPSTLIRIVHPEDRPAFEAHRHDARQQAATKEIEYRIIRADGEIRWISHVCQVVLDADRKFLGNRGSNRDITERKVAEAALEATLQENRDLLGELQHRVKNSFGMICSLISLSTRADSPPETRAALEELDLRVRSISELYSLLYSSGSFVDVRLDEYCARVTAALGGLSRGNSLVTDVESITVPARVAAPIGLIVTELTTNALKHAFPDGKTGTIVVSLRKTAGGAILEVNDDGVGLPPGFDPAVAPGIGTGMGTGMGLNLVQALSTQINGDFTMQGGTKGTRCALSFALQAGDKK